MPTQLRSDVIPAPRAIGIYMADRALLDRDIVPMSFSTNVARRRGLLMRQAFCVGGGRMGPRRIDTIRKPC